MFQVIAAQEAGFVGVIVFDFVDEFLLEMGGFST
jgi:hypothetical protein